MPQLPRRLRYLLVSALATVLFLSIAALATGGPGKGKPPVKGAPAAAAQYQYGPAGKQYGKTKVTICHKGKSIKVAQPAVKAHLRHGDTLGACP